MLKSIDIYNKYLNETDYNKRAVLYKDFNKECRKEYINKYIKKFSFNKECLELIVLPFVFIYIFLID